MQRQHTRPLRATADSGEHFLPTSFWTKLTLFYPQNDSSEWSNVSVFNPISRVLTILPRPQRRPSVAVVLLAIPLQVLPTLGHDDTAAQTSELGDPQQTPHLSGGARRLRHREEHPGLEASSETIPVLAFPLG